MGVIAIATAGQASAATADHKVLTPLAPLSAPSLASKDAGAQTAAPKLMQVAGRRSRRNLAIGLGAAVIGGIIINDALRRERRRRRLRRNYYYGGVNRCYRWERRCNRGNRRACRKLWNRCGY